MARDGLRFLFLPAKWRLDQPNSNLFLCQCVCVDLFATSAVVVL